MTKKTIDEMMQLIQNNTHHEDIGRYLDEADLSVEELLELNHALYNFNAIGWELQISSNERGVNPFDVISFLEASVAILARTGDEGYADWMRGMFELAIRYSDQAGLRRKFSLLTELVASTKQDLTREERSVLFYTRSLNRLAQLTDYWRGKDQARPLWKELFDYVLNFMEADEQLEALNVIRSNAPWFAEENKLYFEF